MVRPLKVTGLDELRSLRTRAARQLALSRISRSDHDTVVDAVERVEAVIASIKERDEQGNEIGAS